MKYKLLFFGLVVIMVGLTAASVSAGVLSTSGITVISPPASVAKNTVESDETIFLFSEQQSVVLESDLVVDITAPGTYGDPPGGMIPAGTCVNSYFIHFDLIQGFIFRTGSVTFDEDVLGLITSNESLDASDWLGPAGTFYAKAADGELGRSLEFGNGIYADHITLSPDLKTVEATLLVNSEWQDQARVITQGNCEPSPPPPAGCNLITSGMTVIAPPASVARNNTESDQTIFVYCEQRSVELGSDLTVDISASGTYGTPDGGTIPAGSCVNSYFIHFDLISGLFFRNGSVSFEEDVLGLIASNGNLDASDWLGAPGTFYPKAADGEIGRRVEFGTGIYADWLTLSANRRTVEATLLVNSEWQDQIRVITQGTCDPGEPNVIEVEIDVKPNSDPSCFNSNGVGVIPVAVLGSETFDVKEIDPASLELDGAPVAVKNSDKLMVAYEDYNHDGYKDLIVKFVDMDNYDPTDEWATLTGFLTDGTPIHGVGDICITQW